MSWQRIDENTYIDDTLVTCAEYQLFIDEMRKQGKYYQPDHWIEYQFPTGKARKPIFGVRSSDALGFCEWLMSRDENKSQYRTPTPIEARNFLIGSAFEKTCGYWAFTNKDASPEFIWMAKSNDDLIVLDLSTLRTDIYGDFVMDFALNRSRSIIRKVMPFFTPTRARKSKKSRDNIIYKTSTDDWSSLNDVLDRNLRFGEFYRGGHPAEPDYFDRVDEINFNCGIVRELILDPYLDLDKTHVQDIYNNLLSLQERIAGRSPAFEGIRLVKERIR